MAGGIIGSVIAGAAAPLANAAAAILPGVLEVVKRFVPDPEKQAAIQLELTQRLLDATSAENQAIAQVAQAQAAINLEEAKSPSFWVSGWRPAAAWCCVAGLAYSFFTQPLLGWACTVMGAAIGANIPSPPVLNMEVLVPLLVGMLGLGGFKTIERVNGAAAPEPGSPLHKAAVIPPAVVVRR